MNSLLSLILLGLLQLVQDAAGLPIAEATLRISIGEVVQPALS